MNFRKKFRDGQTHAPVLSFGSTMDKSNIWTEMFGRLFSRSFNNGISSESLVNSLVERIQRLLSKTSNILLILMFFSVLCLASFLLSPGFFSNPFYY